MKLPDYLSDPRRVPAFLAGALLLVFVFLFFRNAGIYPIVFIDEWSYSSATRMLPMADAPAPAALPDPVAPDVPTRPLPQRVLLVDDEVDITDALGAFLQRFGVACTAVANEADAALHLQQAAAHGLPFDALLCDYRLADGADGLAAALGLRERFAPGLPLLLVTGETAPARLQRVRDAHVPVLFKPVRAEQLLDALAGLCTPVRP